MRQACRIVIHVANGKFCLYQLFISRHHMNRANVSVNPAQRNSTELNATDRQKPAS